MNREIKLNPLLSKLSRHLKGILLESIIHSINSQRLIERNLLKIISYLRRVIDSLKQLVLTETGQMEEVFSITMRKLSSCGLMRKINLELFPCKMVLILRKSSIDFAELALILRRLPNSHLGYITSCPTNLGTALRASVHIHLPLLGKSKDAFQAIADKYYV
jgi:ATP:guanido phosphotransferase, C-terminal catalytic domain